MTKNSSKYLILFIISVFFSSCNKDDNYTEIPLSPIKVDLTQVPYPKLSDYGFFEGDIKNQSPSLGVLPYAPASSLFTDYAHKKRFVWIPENKKATQNGDMNVLELPVGSALIKTFYYDNVQNVSPVGASRIIETRIMIRKSSGWIFANYVWNEDQTEANLDLVGSNTLVTWLDENNTIKSTNYRIPNEAQCIVCHKKEVLVGGSEVISYIPIGIKPQNLNFDYNYGNETKNQLTKWVEKGYLESAINFPSEENTTVDYNDSSKPIDKRARSYVDINCAHCHQEERHCDYRPMRFGFNETLNNEPNMGVCVDTQDMQDFPNELNRIVQPQNVSQSMLFYRINTTNEAYRMPLHGRTIIHTEGVLLMKDWINSLHDCN
ncbi:MULTISPECIES: hypothetical protein [Flavobacterium]|uniref:Repeat protein (TIGR03806 family) n=1 Tax=Flavobacterium jumunjinense TaxID=998845 RepID=A0ABV5GNX6_9FLAO|nr:MULTISPECIES: hypothetical protein [Flavobacterium]